MPYKKLTELPETIQKLPKHAQEIYMKAFNAAFELYKSPIKRRGKESREVVAQKVAWSAIKKVYEKNEKGKWIRKKLKNKN